MKTELYQLFENDKPTKKVVALTAAEAYIFNLAFATNACNKKYQKLKTNETPTSSTR